MLRGKAINSIYLPKKHLQENNTESQKECVTKTKNGKMQVEHIFWCKWPNRDQKGNTKEFKAKDGINNKRLFYVNNR